MARHFVSNTFFLPLLKNRLGQTLSNWTFGFVIEAIVVSLKGGVTAELFDFLHMNLNASEQFDENHKAAEKIKQHILLVFILQ